MDNTYVSRLDLMEAYASEILELKLEVNNALYLLGIPLITRIIAEIHLVALWLRTTEFQSQRF